MKFFKLLFDKKPKNQEQVLPDQSKEIKSEPEFQSLHDPKPNLKPVDEMSAAELQPEVHPNPEKRSIRVFVSSTFRDMIEDRNALMTHTWPELRRFCRERHVELVEVDLRWGIAEEQSTRKETLKLCLDEIRACRPFFIGLLGERYGWVPGDDAFTADLKEEQPWLRDLHGKSVTELEILHGVLNKPEMAGRVFFYFRNPEYAKGKGADFLSETPDEADKQKELKDRIRKTCAAKNIPLHETYPDPDSLPLIVLKQLHDAIDKQFPIEDIPDPLDREARDHEAFAEMRRRTYIGRPDYYEALDHHASGEGTPLVLLGDSGSGKSALLANWIDRWRMAHPKDFIFQHYIGGTSDSAVHWRLITRLMAEIKRWTNDTEELPKTNDDILRDFYLWLSKARIKAEHDGISFIVVLDALNQLEDKDHGRLLGWLPEHPITGALRLIVSTLPGDSMDVLEKRAWPKHCIQPLTRDERRRMIEDYLARFGKKLDDPRLDRLSAEPAAANPLYLKILLDELRVTGTHDKLDERLDDYLAAKDIPTLLGKVLARYQKDYEKDRKGLVSEALGLIWAARRGLTEAELLQLLRPSHLPQLPLATWAPLRAALEEGLVDRGGILNFAHDFLRASVEAAFLPDLDKKVVFRTALADYFEAIPPTARSCNELPWLLRQSELFERLRKCLLDIDCFLEILKRDEDELRSYWVCINEERSMGKSYLDSLNAWIAQKGTSLEQISYAANALGFFLSNASLHYDAEPLFNLNLQIDEDYLGKDHPTVARDLNNLAALLQATNRLSEAESLIKRAYKIDEEHLGKDHPIVARDLNTLATLLLATNRLEEAESLFRRALKIYEGSFGKYHPNITIILNNLAQLLERTNRYSEAESLMKRSLNIDENSLGLNHPKIVINLNNLAALLIETKRTTEAESLMRRAMIITEKNFGPDHSYFAICIGNLASLLQDLGRLDESEPLMMRALTITENIFGMDHPNVAIALNNLAWLLKITNRMAEAEQLMERALIIDEKSFGPNHPSFAIGLNNIALILMDTNQLKDAETALNRALIIDESSLGPNHPYVARDLNNLAQVFKKTNRFVEAEKFLKRALQIDEMSFGSNSTKVSLRLQNLSGLFLAANRLADAEPLMKKVLIIDQESFGIDHPNVAKDLIIIAQLLVDTNRMDEAEPHYRRALKIKEENFGKEHKEVATILYGLAQLLADTNRMGEAEPLYRRALKINEESFGEAHPEVANILNGLAQLLTDTNRLGEAEPLYRRALKINEESFGTNHPTVATILNGLARLLKIANRIGEAEPLYRKALQIDEENFGQDHANVARDLNNLALLLKTSNRLNEAEPLMIRALKITEDNFGENHPNMAIDLNNLASLYLNTNRMSEAEPLLIRALKIAEDIFGENHMNVARHLNNLATLYHNTNRLDEAEPLYRRSLQIDKETFGKDHPNVSTSLNNLAQLLQGKNDLKEAETLMLSGVEILIRYARINGYPHPNEHTIVNNYALLLKKMGWNKEQIDAQLRKIAPEFFEE